jgi:hypothetical protein
LVAISLDQGDRRTSRSHISNKQHTWLFAAAGLIGGTGSRHLLLLALAAFAAQHGGPSGCGCSDHFDMRGGPTTRKAAGNTACPPDSYDASPSGFLGICALRSVPGGRYGYCRLCGANFFEIRENNINGQLVVHLDAAGAGDEGRCGAVRCGAVRCGTCACGRGRMRGRAGARRESGCFCLSLISLMAPPYCPCVRAFCRSSGRAVRRQRASASPRGARAGRVAGPPRAGEAACVRVCVRACVCACVRACVRASTPFYIENITDIEEVLFTAQATLPRTPTSRRQRT